MKKIIRNYVINTVSLYLVSMLTEGLLFEKGIESLLLAGVGITLVSLLVKPIINLLLLPINLITFGLFRWVSSAIALYLVTLIVPGIRISGFFFAGLSSQWIDVPAVSLGGVFAFIAFSFILSLFVSAMTWLTK